MSRVDEAAQVADDIGYLASAAGALASRETSRVSRSIGWAMLAMSAVKTVQRIVDKQVGKRTFTVAVQSDDDIYPELHDWVLRQLVPSERKALVARSSRSRSDEMVSPDSGDETPPARLRLFYDGSQAQTIMVSGHRVDVSLNEPGGNSGRNDDDLRLWLRKERLVFNCRGEQARDALVGVLDQLVAGLAATREPRVFVAERWGGWNLLQDRPIRSIESVILRDGQKETLIEDLRSFLASEAVYVDLGIPYHRSILLHGPPGTGKTSIARALAAHLGLDLRFIPLSVVPDDGTLMNLLNGVGSRSLLLLEDVDIARATRERDDGDKRVTLSGLLNGLDGVVTPHGLIVVMTTNNRDVLDEALIRPGRVDRHVHVDHLDDAQLAELVAAVGHPGVYLPALRGRKISPASVVEVIKRHLHDEDTTSMLNEMHALIEGREPETMGA